MTQRAQAAIAYLVSRYPAVSHTFILREVKALRARGLRVEVASVNASDRAPDRMTPEELAEDEATYHLKPHGTAGALGALAWAVGRQPRALAATLAEAWSLAQGARRFYAIAYAVEAAMVARWMHARGLPHLHVHFGNEAALVGTLVKSLTGCGLSLTVHGPDEFDDVRGQHLARKVELADMVVCISQFARSQLMRLSAPEHWTKLRLCRLGVDPQWFQPAEHRGGGVLRLLSVGRLTPAKGQVLLVQACARLRSLGVDFELTLVGDGPDRSRVATEVARHGLGDRVRLAGALDPHQVRALLRAADLFLLPSLAEGIPVVLMEAMACGVPCVTTPVNGIPELIEHGRSGLLAAPGDVEALVHQLQRALRDTSLRARLAAAGRDKVVEDFNLGRNVDRLFTLFCRLPAIEGAPR